MVMWLIVDDGSVSWNPASVRRIYCVYNEHTEHTSRLEVTTSDFRSDDR